MRPRWLARLAIVLALAAAVVPFAAAGVRGSIALILVGLLGIAVALAAAWSFLAHRGLARWLAAAVLVAVPVAVVVLYAWAEPFWVVLVTVALWSAALAAGRAALAAPIVPHEHETPPPRRPFLIMNPRSGGGKVEKFHLAERARRLGAEVVLLDGPTDVAALARQAVRDGADLLGVAGGDGTQALVAGVAAEHGVPFMVIPAGTRNHFALDLGLDRQDPATSLDALADGVEVWVDLGQVVDRTFVNNVSFGAYAAVVRSPAYRDDKAGTTLDLLPDLLAGQDGPGLRVRVGDTVLTGPLAVLVSNNPYSSDDITGVGRRPRLDRGVLGVMAVTMRGAMDATRLVRGLRSKVLTITTGDRVVVEADAPLVPVGIDGEAVSLPVPVSCTIRRRALRVRVPRHRPGVPPPRPSVDWARLGRLALTGR